MNPPFVSIVSLFETQGTVMEVTPLGQGLINDTYLVKTSEPDKPDYVLQRINHHVFTNVEGVMSNIRAVTRHIRRKLEECGATDIDRRVLQFVPLRENSQKLYAEENGEFWRMMVYVACTVTHQQVNTSSSKAAGMAFGDFQRMLSDIPDTLVETIPNFHNMEFRLEQLRQVMKENPAGRVDEPEVKTLLTHIEEEAWEMCKAERMGREGILPKRICHCDTKVNNMLFDEQDHVLCVIDLDTVMPNFIFSDYGDFLRSASSSVPEDYQKLQEVAFRMDIFQAFTDGYLSSTDSFLTETERVNLPYAVTLFPYMQSVRFLWDYLSGDHYWKCKYDRHNLTRALNQFTLFRDMQAQVPDMKRYIVGR